MKVQNRLNKKKNQISDFSDIYFSSYDNFCSKNCQFSMNIHDMRNISASSNLSIKKIYVYIHIAELKVELTDVRTQ